MTATATPPCEKSSHLDALNRTKGFLGTTLGEISADADRPVLAEIQAMSDATLVIAGELAMQDIGDNLLILDELRQRFRKGIHFKGYDGWSDFITKNSRYSLRTIQTKLAAVNGKDESKVNHIPGNKWTRDVELVGLANNADVVQEERVTTRDEMAYQTDPSAPITYPMSIETRDSQQLEYLIRRMISLGKALAQVAAQPRWSTLPEYPEVLEQCKALTAALDNLKRSKGARADRQQGSKGSVVGI
jgi:hypothetical protein